jgi:glycosyltransferase involved in cell wall biosynthesis
VDGYTIERAHPFAFLHKGYLSVDLARRYRRLSREADVVNFHLPMLDAAWLTPLTPRGTPLIATYQCDIQAVGGVVDRLAVAAVNFASRLNLERSASVVVLSRDYASGSPVLAPLLDRCVEGYAPIKLDCPTTMAQPDDSADFRAGFLGRFVKEKGIDVLVDAVEHALKRLPRLKLILAGEYSDIAGGSIYEQLKPKLSRLGDRVQLLGRLDEAALPAFYRSLDVFVLPSINAYEAFGMVQIEAMLAGTPVIASDMRGVRVPVQLTGNGLLARPGDSASLGEAILAMADKSAPNRDEIADRTLGIFSNEKFLSRYAHLIEQALEGPSEARK